MYIPEIGSCDRRPAKGCYLNRLSGNTGRCLKSSAVVAEIRSVIGGVSGGVSAVPVQETAARPSAHPAEATARNTMICKGLIDMLM